MILSCRAACTVVLALVAAQMGCDTPTVVVPGGKDGPSDPGIAGLREIRVNPASVTLIAGHTPAEQRFEALGTFDDGHTEDITTRVNWSLSSQNLGRISEISTFQTGTYGGEGTIFARSGSLTGKADIRVRVERRFVEMDAMGAGEQSFGGAADALSPRIVYPYDGVLMPPNLGSLEIHWLKGNSSHDIYEISIQNQVTDLRAYTGCKSSMDGSGCIYEVSKELWALMSYSNLGNTDGVSIGVRSTSLTQKTVGTSRPISLGIAREDLRGGIYYWSTNQSSSGIYRLDLEKHKVEAFYTATMGPKDHEGNQKCVGCHAISHDGNRMSVILGGGHISDLVQINVGNLMPTLTQINTQPNKTARERQFSNFQSYSADGNTFVAALSGRLRLVRAAGAMAGTDQISMIDTGGRATHPHWGRSGSYLAFTRYSDVVPTVFTRDEGDGFEQYVSRGAIGLLRWNGTSFEQPRTLVAEKAGQNSYYPTISPNDQYVVFNRVSGCGTADPCASCKTPEACNLCKVNDPCTAYDNKRARLFMVPLGGGSEIELASINRRGPNDTRDDLTNSWPKFSPFRQVGNDGRTVLWVTFSSKRNYGLRLPQNSDRPQLWMAAVVVTSEGLTGDPSRAPFWIPGQDLKTHNHIAQWTEYIVPVLP